MDPLLLARTDLVIKRALATVPLEQCAIACSWGKDSIAVVDRVRKQYPGICVLHCNTGVDHPLTYHYRDAMLKHWDLNYHEVHGDLNFWQISEKYGLPGVRLQGKARVPKCCIYLKEKPADDYYKANNIKMVFTGITAAESRNRFMLQARCGDLYLTKASGIYKCHPIMDWSEANVWQYLKEEQVPYNPFYDAFPGHRCGCQPCTSYLSWTTRMAKENPKMYRRIQTMKGQELIDDTGVVN